MHHVFVSYSRRDAEWVQELIRRIEGSGTEVWVDQRDIPVTLPWFEKVRDAIVEAALFLICDSPASQGSQHCASEAAIAFDAGKRACMVAVGTDIAPAHAQVRKALNALEPDYRLRTELRVLARDWDRAMRPRGALVSQTHRRRLERAARIEPALDAVELAFLRASRRRTRRRQLATGVTVAVASCAALAYIVSEARRGLITQANDSQAAAYMRARELELRGARDHYLALTDASQLGGDESAAHAIRIMEALHNPVPDDGFRVPSAAVRFAPGPVGRTVAVTDGRGRAWARAESARETRESKPARVEEPKDVAADGLTVTAVRDTGIIEVFRDGVLWRRLHLTRRTRTAVVSPNGRELAVAIGGAVLIADLERAQVRMRLRASDEAVRDVRWSEDGRRVWALSDELVVSWTVREGENLVDDSDLSFNAVFGAADPGSVWAAADGGEIVQLAVSDGRVVERRRVADAIRSAAGAPDGSVAAVSGDRGIWIVPLEGGGEPRRLPVTDCALGRPAFVDAETLYVPCLSGPLLRVSVGERKIVERRDLSPGGIFAVRALPRSGTLLATDVYGWIYAVAEDGLREIVKLGCGGHVMRLGVSPDERILVPAGSGIGLATCGIRGVRTGDPATAKGWRFDHVVSATDTPTLADAAAVSRGGGTFAYGFTDGTVVLHPTENLIPSRSLKSISGRVRDLHVTADNELIVATDAGVIRRIELCESCLSNRELAREAHRRAERGIEIGTARRR